MIPDLAIAIETSSRQGGVALAAGETLLGTRTISGDRRHAAELLPTIRGLLAEHGRRFEEISLFAYSQGPGSFTGLRIAAAAAAAAQLITRRRVTAVPTLEAIAMNAASHPGGFTRAAVLLDARGGRVYAALYAIANGEVAHPIIDPGLFEAEQFFDSIKPPFALVGEGVAVHGGLCEKSGGVVLGAEWQWPSAEKVLRIGLRQAALGQICEPGDIVPLYLRPPACEEVYEQRRAAARERRGE